MTRALITGISGMVGSHLCDYLLEHTNWDIYGLARWRSNLRNLAQHLDRIERGARLHLLHGDLGDAISIGQAVERARPDYVFHLAAQSFPKASFDAPLETYNANIMGTTRVLDAVRKTNPTAVVHVCSSSEVFGRVSQAELPIQENCRFHPASPYAISKVGTDLIGRFYAEAYGMNVQITRMFTHTGPRRHDAFVESNFAKQIAMIEAGKLPPIIKVGNLKSLRTWADARDAVRAYHLLATRNPQPGACYNIGGEYACTVGEMLQTLLGMSVWFKDRTPITIEEDSSRLRPIDADLQVPDTTKFRRHTDWRPEISFEQTMLDLLNYWRDRVAAGDEVLYR